MERDGSRGAGNHAASRDYRFLWIRLGLGSFGTGLGKKAPHCQNSLTCLWPSRLMAETASAPQLVRDLAGHSRETEMGTEGCWRKEVKSRAKTRGSHSLIVELDTGQQQTPNPHLAVPRKEPPSSVKQCLR